MGAVEAPFPFNLPCDSGASAYFKGMEDKFEFILPPVEEGVDRHRTMKMITRAIVTVIVFPVFAFIGAVFNVLTGLSMAAIGVAKQLLPDKNWYPEVKDCYEKAFKHFAYGLLDLISFIGSPYIIGAYSLDPRQLEKYCEEIGDKIRDKDSYMQVRNWLDIWSWEKVEE